MSSFHINTVVFNAKVLFNRAANKQQILLKKVNDLAYSAVHPMPKSYISS